MIHSATALNQLDNLKDKQQILSGIPQCTAITFCRSGVLKALFASQDGFYGIQHRGKLRGSWVSKMKRILSMDSRYICTTQQIYLMPQHSTLKKS